MGKMMETVAATSPPTYYVAAFKLQSPRYTVPVQLRGKHFLFIYFFINTTEQFISRAMGVLIMFAST